MMTQEQPSASPLSAADNITPEVDRLTPCERPHEAHIGYQTWRDLLFAHWAVDPDQLTALLPKGLELDLWRGEALVGVVPFYMEGVRPKWAPRWSAFNFYELNVRTYVLHRGEPGVYFFSLDAASWIAVCAARVGWSLPYYPARFHQSRLESRITYRAHRILPRGAYLDVEYELGEVLGASKPETLEHFLLERYLLFTERRGVIYRGQVHHTPYPAQRAHLMRCESNLIETLGIYPLEREPRYVHYASGVEVDIFPLRPVT